MSKARRTSGGRGVARVGVVEEVKVILYGLLVWGWRGLLGLASAVGVSLQDIITLAGGGDKRRLGNLQQEREALIF